MFSLPVLRDVTYSADGYTLMVICCSLRNPASAHLRERLEEAEMRHAMFFSASLLSVSAGRVSELLPSVGLFV